jgi:hypothetical protein
MRINGVAADLTPAVLTFASAGTGLAKRITVVDGVITRTDDPAWPRVLSFETVEAGTPEELLEVLAEAAEREPAPCAVRAEPLCERGRRALYDDRELGPAGLRAVPRAWVGYDFEKIPAGDIDPLTQPERAVAKARRCLPPAHHDATVVWQITASAGKRPNELRLRLWFQLARPVLGKQLAAWCRAGTQSKWLDPVTLLNEVCPHFLAVTIAGNSPDPCPQRWGLIRGERDRVTVPETVLAPLAQCKAITVADEPARYGPALALYRRVAVEQIKASIESVRAAAEGARHPAYLHAAARIHGLCEHWRIPLDRPRALLEEAYLATLTPDEARRRARGSTRGVWDWLDRRASA